MQHELKGEMQDLPSFMIYELDAIFVFRTFRYKKYQKCNPSLKTDKYKLSQKTTYPIFKTKNKVM